jgi:hypothetical protein
MVSTLGEAYDLSWRIRARCAAGNRDAMKSVRKCLNVSELHLPTLLWTRGRDFPLALLGDRLRCPRCGSRIVAVYFEPPANAGRQRQ